MTLESFGLTRFGAIVMIAIILIAIGVGILFARKNPNDSDTFNTGVGRVLVFIVSALKMVQTFCCKIVRTKILKQGGE